MIAQVLNRGFLLEVAELAREEFGRELSRRESGGRRRGLAGPLDEADDGEVRDLRDSLAALAEESAKEAAEREAPEKEPPKDDFAYIPRDPLMSLLQTTIEEHVEESDEIEVEESPLRGGRRATGGEPAVTDRRIAGIPLTADAARRRKWGDMEIARNPIFSDPGWLTSGFAMAARFFRGRAKWVDRPPMVPVAERARIVLVGDWGSGLPRAKKVADQIRRVLAEDDSLERHVVHLGDVYYSGSKREYERNFLNLWPVDDGGDIRSFSLCGNHDMYYGGHAYYGTCLADSRFSDQRGCSHFVLESPHWKLIALDTGYEDGGLQGEQANWARQLIDEAPTQQGIALLSHHQLFSAHEDGAKVLREKIGPVLETERVDAWFWGHEHRCIQYEETRQLDHRVGFASCLGHGGVPEYLVMAEGETKPKPWVYEYLKPFAPDEPWETFGFAIVDLDGPRMSVRYVDEDGNEHHRVPEVAVRCR